MLAAPITPVDLAQVAGSAAWPSSAPAMAGGARVGGNEGLGIVEEAAAGSGLKKGDLVVASRGGLGTWATHVIAPGDAWTAVPAAVQQGDIETVAACVGPVLSARHFLKSFVQLKEGEGAGAPSCRLAVCAAAPHFSSFPPSLSLPTHPHLCSLSAGDVVMVNNGSSMVSQAVLQLAVAGKLRCVSLVRSNVGADWAEVSPHLTSLGASLVVSEEKAASHEFTKTMTDLPKAKLALNSSGGPAALLLARHLAVGGTLVTCGTEGRRSAISAPLDIFTARDLTLRGLNAAAWSSKLSKAERDAEVVSAVTAVSQKQLRLLVARETFADFSHALARFYRPGDGRQITLTF